MRIIDLDTTPFYELPYLNASRRGGSETVRLPFFRGRAVGMPSDCKALVIASDLQGRVTAADSELILLGEALADQIDVLAASEMLPAPEAIGVVLAGDLYTVPAADKRGGTGDVRSVWESMATVARWVVGVAGNHDDFGSVRQERKLTSTEGIAILDGALCELGGVSFGGVGYVVGNPDKAGKRDQEVQLDLLDQVLAERPDVLVIHEGPLVGHRQYGSAAISERLESGGPPLVICGHHGWVDPTAQVGDSAVLNVHERVVVLSPAPGG